MSKPDWAERLQRTFNRKYEAGLQEGRDMQKLDTIWILQDMITKSKNAETKRFLTQVIDAIRKDK